MFSKTDRQIQPSSLEGQRKQSQYIYPQLFVVIGMEYL